MTELFIAFAAATLAFVFFLFGEALLKAYDRSKTHYDALVFFERLLNLQLDEIFVVELQAQTMRPSIENGHALIDLPRPITKPEGLYLELLDIDLVNRLFSAGVLLRRANNDVENLREAYARLLERYLDKTLPRDAYIENATFVVNGFERLGKGLGQYRQEAEDILARIRLRLAAGTPKAHRAVRRLTSLLMVKAAPLSEESVQAERARLTEEVALVRSRSRDRIAQAREAKDGA